MNVTANELRELHRIHKQLADLRSRVERGPRQLRAGENSVAACDAELTRAQDDIKQAKVASDKKQLQLKQREERIEELKKKLNTAASNKEFQTLKDQIAADQQANEVLSDEILESLEKIDGLEMKVRQAEEKQKQAQTELDKTRDRVNAEQAGLEAELARVQAELDTAVAQLPGDFRRDYERLARAHGEDALAQVEGDCCGGCYQRLTPQTLNELSMARPLFCNSCGCLIYLPEDRTVSGRPQTQPDDA